MQQMHIGQTQAALTEKRWNYKIIFARQNCEEKVYEGSGCNKQDEETCQFETDFVRSDID